MIDLVKTAQLSDMSAKYMLFDSWFSSPKTITALKTDCGLDTIAVVKKSSKIQYGYQEGRYNIKEIYRQCKKRRGRSRYLLSVDITVGNKAIPAKIICVRNKSRKKGLACYYLYGYNHFRRRNHSYLWKTLGH